MKGRPHSAVSLLDPTAAPPWCGPVCWVYGIQGTCGPGTTPQFLLPGPFCIAAISGHQGAPQWVWLEGLAKVKGGMPSERAEREEGPLLRRPPR